MSQVFRAERPLLSAQAAGLAKRIAQTDLALKGNAVKDFSRVFGLKGRFCQPRPKAWEEALRDRFRPERAIRQVTSLPNRPFRANEMPKTPSFSQAFGLG